MSFIAFIFTGVIWLPNGSPQPPVTRLEANLEACRADAEKFANNAEAFNNDNSPAMRMTWHVDCRPVLNTSEADGA